MFTLTLKGFWAHKVRYALTSLAIVLGVAFMAGTMVLTDSMQKTFDGVFAAANEGTDVIVRHPEAFRGEFSSDSRGRVDAGLVAQVATVGGVGQARGSIEGRAQLVLPDGSTSKTDGLGTTVGANWIDADQLTPFRLASGHIPTAPDEVVLDKHTADAEHWSLGDAIGVLGKGGPATLKLVGTATYGELDGVPGSSLVATVDATAQQLFAEPGRYDRVVVAAVPGVSADDLAERVQAAVAVPGSDLEVLTGKQDTAAKQAEFKEDVGFINSFLMAFAFVSLFVGTFIIYNTFSIVVAQRMKAMALLRALGARRAQVLRSVVLESIVVGLLSAAAGLAAGVGLSFGLRAMLGSAGLELPSGGIVVSTATIVTAFVVGVTVSVLSAVVPAVRASRARPVAALRDVAVDRSGVSFGRAVVGVLLTGAGVAAFAAGLSASGSNALPLIGVGALTVIMGVFTLGPVLVRPIMWLLGLPVALLGITGRFARQNVRRNPKRTAATSSALMVGVALVGFITILAASTKASVVDLVDRSFRSDYVVDSGSWAQGFSTAIEHDVRAIPSVQAVSPLRMTSAQVDGVTTPIMGLDTSVIDSLYDLDVSSGSISAVGPGAVAVAADKADDAGLHVGDQVSFRFADGAVEPLTVAAVFNGHTVGGDASWIVGLDTFNRHVTDQFDRKLFVKVDPAVPAAESRAAVDGALSTWPNAELQDRAGFERSIAEPIDALLNLVYGLLALAILIALIGIANTLALSVHERRRELGLLRAIGMQRKQLRRTVRRESLLIAVLGTALGAVLAVGGAWAIVRALADEGVTRFVVPSGQLAIILALACLAGLLAAAGPARRAARLNVLDAIATE